MPIDLFIVDDSEAICNCLHALFSSVTGITSIREANTLSEALVSARADPVRW